MNTQAGIPMIVKSITNEPDGGVKMLLTIPGDDNEHIDYIAETDEEKAYLSNFPVDSEVRMLLFINPEDLTQTRIVIWNDTAKIANWVIQ